VSPNTFDDLARDLAAPMPRGKALRMLAAGLVVASVPGMSARRARAADPPPPCSTGGTFCGNVNPLGKKGYNIGCCLGGPGETRTVCCPGIPGVVGSLCCPTGYICGNKSKDYKEGCICASDVVCGSTCCKKREYCYSYFGFDQGCVKLCFDGREYCGSNCCSAGETCGLLGCTCPSNKVRCGGDCCSPRDTVDDPWWNFAPFNNIINMASQSAAVSGGRSSRRAMFARPAQSSSAAVDAALDALAAVNGQGAAAMLAVSKGKRDPAFKQKVRVARATPPKVSADAVLNARSAAALNKLLVAEA
jgi:hypothetical protein